METIRLWTKSLAVYILASFNALRLRPSFSTLGYALRYCFDCLITFHGKRSDFLTLAQPWLCFPAARHLNQLDFDQAKVFEYGSGGSTIYFGQRASEVYSVEHEPAWYDRVQVELSLRGMTNVFCLLVQPEPNGRQNTASVADPKAYASSDERTAGMNFENYVRTIDRFPDGYFDLVIVDGRARPSCLAHAMRKVRMGGILLLDQSERPHYLSNILELKDRSRWQLERYMGPLPQHLHFTEASFFTKIQS